jgi:sporulation protein YlmC with PRC-barrel domain
MLNIKELRKKTVINMPDGKRMGKITDLVFDDEMNIAIIQTGMINKNQFGVRHIKRIGEEVILIDLGVQ